MDKENTSMKSVIREEFLEKRRYRALNRILVAGCRKMIQIFGKEKMETMEVAGYIFLIGLVGTIILMILNILVAFIWTIIWPFLFYMAVSAHLVAEDD